MLSLIQIIFPLIMEHPPNGSLKGCSFIFPKLETPPFTPCSISCFPATSYMRFAILSVLNHLFALVDVSSEYEGLLGEDPGQSDKRYDVVQ